MMGKTFQVIIILVFLLLLNASMAAADNILEQEIIKINDYTGEEYIYTENISVKILDEVARQIFQSFTYSYHPEDEVPEKVSVTIIKPDGAIVELSNPVGETNLQSENDFRKSLVIFKKSANIRAVQA